ncbi:MAG: hypothetical protein JNM34_12850 [Chthonomonadaceae bacterium]|nr:hypothetical protein [Chthonomonadaceae bacterium]
MVTFLKSHLPQPPHRFLGDSSEIDLGEFMWNVPSFEEYELGERAGIAKTFLPDQASLPSALFLVGQDSAIWPAYYCLDLPSAQQSGKEMFSTFTIIKVCAVAQKVEPITGLLIDPYSEIWIDGQKHVVDGKVTEDHLTWEKKNLRGTE